MARTAPRWVALIAVIAIGLASLARGQAQTAEPQYPVGSRIGLVPPTGMSSSTQFQGFEDTDRNVFIRLVAMPARAFAAIEQTMTNDALKQQGLQVEKREALTLASGKAILIVARQQAGDVKFGKWMLIASISDLTALISFEIRDEVRDSYPEPVIRAALTSAAVRASVPMDEQLTMLPFQITDLAGFRVVRVLPGLAIQLTDGAEDSSSASKQPHLVVAIAPGAPPEARDRDTFARTALTSGLPPIKELRVTSSEPMRIGGQQGHELRATGKDPTTGLEIDIVQWLRFGTGGFMRIIGFAPKKGWTQSFTRFRTVRDNIQPQ